MVGPLPAKQRLGKQIAACLDSLRFRNKGSARGYTYSFSSDPSSVANKLMTAAALNQIWQAWTFYCREFWLAYEQKFGSSAVASRRQEDLLNSFLKGNDGYGSKWKNAKQLAYYNEPTWGDADKLDCALQRAFQAKEVKAFQMGVRLAYSDLKDVQKIRNALIHPSRGSIEDIQLNVSPRYSIRVNSFASYPLPQILVYSTQIKTQDIAIEAWARSIIRCAFMH